MALFSDYVVSLSVAVVTGPLLEPARQRKEIRAGKAVYATEAKSCLAWNYFFLCSYPDKTKLVYTC